MSEELKPDQEYANWKAPETGTARKRPGGELYGKPVQGPDGQWYSKYGERLTPEEAETQTLQTIHSGETSTAGEIKPESSQRTSENTPAENSIANSIENLPALKPDHIRLTHITNPELVESILLRGLNYEAQGMISSTTRAYTKEADVEYGSSDPRFSAEGMKVVVLDIPASEYRQHNDVTRSPGIIPPEYIVGVVDANRL